MFHKAKTSVSWALVRGEFCRWIKMSTPDNRLRVIRLLEMAAAILRQEQAASAA